MLRVVPVAAGKIDEFRNLLVKRGLSADNDKVCT